MFRSAAESAPAGPERDVLLMICKLYGLHQIEEQAGAFLKCQSPRSYTSPLSPTHLLPSLAFFADGYFTPSHLDTIESLVDDLCASLRAVAVPVVDSFALSDHIINSPLGRYDGDVYQAYFDQVRRANPLPKVHPYFDRLIKPLLERQPVHEEGVTVREMGKELDEEIEEMKEGAGEEGGK